MAEGRSKANIPELIAAANRLNGAHEDFENAIQQVKATISGLEGGWSSPTQQAISNAFFETHSQTLSELSELIGEYENAIREYAQGMSETDQDISSFINSQI